MPRRTPRDAPTVDDAASFYQSLQEIVRRARQREEDSVCNYGISVRECHALELLADGPLSLNGLAAPLGLDKSTVSRLVQRLVDEKLVNREADSHDNRAVVLVLTAKGRKLYEAAYRDSLACYRVLLEAVPRAERAAVLESLRTAARLVARRDD